MMFSKKFFASRLKELRGVRSQAEMATMIGITQQGWARYETGKVLPGAEVLHQICVTCKVSADWLLVIGDSPKSSDTDWRERALTAEQQLGLIKSALKQLSE